jgi:chemotaxis protein CheZ
MSDMQIKLGRTLLTSMVAMREQKGEISLQDVGGIFMQMASSLNPSASVVDNFMHQEIARLAQYINNAKQEIFSIQTNDKAEDAIFDASQHLDEVIKSTEEATNTIMDAADVVQNLISGVGGEKEKQIMEATTRIYDACTFQDITGQRINKVITLLANIEERIGKLNSLFGAEPQMGENNSEKTAKPAGEIVLPKDDKDLLNGPQLAGKGQDQAAIDALMAGFN